MSVYHLEHPANTFEDTENDMSVKQLESFSNHSKYPADTFEDIENDMSVKQCNAFPDSSKDPLDRDPDGPKNVIVNPFEKINNYCQPNPRKTFANSRENRFDASPNFRTYPADTFSY